MALRDDIRAALRIPAREVTDEGVYRDRRRLLAALAVAPALGLAGCAGAEPPTPTRAEVSPSLARMGFDTDETLTTLQDATSYNNFYEFGTDKLDPSRAERTLQARGWTVAVGGHCARPGTATLDELLAGASEEERTYRLRCVEGWSMVIPWLGVPLADVLRRFEPTSRAKYVAFTTLADPRKMPGVRYPALDWPYREGLRIDEAMHPLAFLATGLYGKPLPQQNGMPLRLLVPWKYGFKSIKSIAQITFAETRPKTFWEEIQPKEYGFWANVNPAVPHPRWSQATERVLGGDGRVKTQLFNGYADYVAGLYRGMEGERLYA